MKKSFSEEYNVMKLMPLLACLLLWNFTIGQKFELGKVTIKELEEKLHPLDSSAGAAIIFKKGDVSVEESVNGFIIIYKVRTKIKIYNTNGYEWGNVKVNYYKGIYSEETLAFSNMNTYNLVNGEIKATKVGKESVFETKITSHQRKKKITFPDVRAGSIIEFEYTLTSPYLENIDRWDFQTTIPINEVEYNTSIPTYFAYNPNFKGLFSPVRTVQNGSSVTRTKYVARDVPAMKEEAFVNNIRNYLCSITHELVVVSFPGRAVKRFTTDWETFTKEIFDNESFGPELNKTGYFDDDIDLLVRGLITPEEKYAAIFNYVKNNIRWDGDYGYFCDGGVKKAYKEKAGGTAEINLMLTAMLRYSGLNANPVIVSTVDNGVSLFPGRSAFNYVVCSVEMNGQLVLMDATEKYAQPGILPMRDLNWIGRLIRKDGTSELVDLIPKTISKESVNMMLSVKSDKITGKIRKQIDGFEGMNYRILNKDVKEDKYLDELESVSKVTIDDYNRQNFENSEEPLIENYSFISDEVEFLGDKIFINPLVFLKMDTNPFRQEKRMYPVDFNYPTEIKYKVTIEIPKGYIVESLPENCNIATDHQIGNFKYLIAANGQSIQVSTMESINQVLVLPENYEILKVFFQKMVDKQNDKIILRKM